MFSKKVDKYTTSITFLTIKENKAFIDRCKEIKTYGAYEINVDYEDIDLFSRQPFIIYLTKKQARENIKALKKRKKYTIKFTGYHFKKVCRETVNVNNKLFLLLMNITMKDKKKYKSPKDFWPSKLSKEVVLYKKPSKKTITLGVKKRSKDFIKNFITKDKIKIYSPKIIYIFKKDLIRYLTKIKEIINKQNSNKKNKFSFIAIRKDDGSLPVKGFVFYLTKSQIHKLNLTKPYQGLIDPILITFSIIQLLRTYEEVITVNSRIYSYLNSRKEEKKFFKSKPYTPPPKLLAISDKPYTPPPKLLAISDKPYNKQELLTLTENLEKDLIDFSDKEEKDLIDFSDKEEKDLIDLNHIIPNPKPTTRGKKYKVLNEDLIQTNTKPSTNGKNILKNILNYPETKRLLGISLTTDLKNKIKNLDSEASFGLASIISSLLTANRGKMSIYSISRNQLKEIIEGFITTLSVLLNPTQKY